MKFRKLHIKTPKGTRITRRSSWFAPYVKRGKNNRTTLGFITRSQCGVYVIRNKRTQEILYVGHSGKQLYKTLYRHFQSWQDQQYRATFGKYAVEVMIYLIRGCENAFMLEQYFLHQLKPKDSKRIEVDKSMITFSRVSSPARVKQVWDIDVPF